MKASRLLSLVLAALALAAPRAYAQGGAELNTITRVQVRGDTVEITGSKKPNFTTFTMPDPPRLVIDIAEAVFADVPEELPGGGAVTGIKTASYGSDASAIARVLIGFERELTPEFEVNGNTLIVKVGGGAPAAVAQQQPPAEQAPAEQPAARPQETPAQQQQAAAPGQSAEDAARAARDEREAQEKAAREAEQRAQAERDAQEKAAREAQARAEAEQQQQRQQQQQQEAERAAAEQRETQERQAQAQREADERAAAEQRAGTQRAAEQRAEQERLAQQRAAEEAARRAELEREAQAREAQAAAPTPEAAPQPAAEPPPRVASVEPRPPARREEAREEGESLRVSGRRKTMTFVGFRQEPSVSRVFVRTNEPVRYSVSRQDARTLVLELENTRITLGNNTRALDTRYFPDTAVLKVDPGMAGSGTTHVVVVLREPAEFQARQEGNEVVLEIPRPGRQAQ